MSLQAVYHLVLVLNVPFQLSDLVPETIALVIVNVLQLFDLPLPGPLLGISLSLHQRVVLVFLDLPPGQAFLGLSPQVPFGSLEVANLCIARLDLCLFQPDSLPEFRNQTVFFSVFFFESSDLAFKLLDLEIVDLPNVFKFLNSRKITEPDFLDYLSSSSLALVSLYLKVWVSASKVLLVL